MRTTTTLMIALALAAAPASAQDGETEASSEASADASAETPAADVPASGGDAADSELGEDSGVGETGIGKTLAERISAVSQPVFLKAGRFELAPFGGVSASDAFFRRWSVGARGSFHILDSLSIDGGGAWNFWSEPLQAAVFLGTDPGELNDESKLLGYADIGVTFSPIYGKIALASEWIIHFDGYLSGGGGGVFSLPDPANPFTPVSPALEVGAGGRIFLTRWMVLRADVRDYIHPGQLGGQLNLQNLVVLNIGLGFYFPFDFEYEREVQKS